MSEHMSEAESLASHGYKSYWILWVILLTVTTSMIFIGESQIPEPAQAIMLLIGSCIKATLIIFFYMHLRFEKMSLILTVLVGIFLTSILMFIIPAFDGSQNILIHRLYQ
jgi:cytochrome c oxidase subunit IV